MNILWWRQLILTISVNENPPSATAADDLGHFSQSDVTLVKNRQQTVSKRKTSSHLPVLGMGGGPCRRVWFLQSRNTLVLIGEVGQCDETFTSAASDPRFMFKPECGAVWSDQGQVSAGEVGRRSGWMRMEIKRFIIKYSWMAAHPCACCAPVANWQLHLRHREHEGGKWWRIRQGKRKILHLCHLTANK